MNQYRIVSFEDILALFSPGSFYRISLSLLLGIMFWNTFIGGFVAISALKRRQFGVLQSKNMPVYFRSALALTVVLLSQWTVNHLEMLESLASWRRSDVLQGYILLTAIGTIAANVFYLEPRTTEIMFERHRLEDKEGKAYTAPGVSSEMKALTQQFGAMHGLSSMFNLVAFLAITFHALWVATFGLEGHQ
ncbi:hypothetical protein DL93DRAFT_2092550 [Clavulina sp. PMI_390]|nr:hypothetical protein DL93DRAFT_2092550 [Clavulina sp. PMI_390]